MAAQVHVEEAVLGVDESLGTGQILQGRSGEVRHARGIARDGDLGGHPVDRDPPVVCGVAACAKDSTTTARPTTSTSRAATTPIATRRRVRARLTLRDYGVTTGVTTRREGGACRSIPWRRGCSSGRWSCCSGSSPCVSRCAPGCLPLLIYLAIGLLLGERFLGVRYDNALLTEILGYAALTVIPHRGGITTQWRGVKRSIGPAVSLATVGVLVSVGVVAFAAHAVLGLPWQTAPDRRGRPVVDRCRRRLSVLRRVPLPRRVAGILEVESGLNDPRSSSS